MNEKFELIDTFSCRPTLSGVARDALLAALHASHPSLSLHPDTVRVTTPDESGQCLSETLSEALHRYFSSGKTPRWRREDSSFQVGTPLPSSNGTTLDVEALGLLIHSVSLGLLDAFIQALVRFWDQPGATAASPGKQLADFLARQNRNRRQEALIGTPAMGFEKTAMQVLNAQLAAIETVPTLGLQSFDEIERYLAKVTDIVSLLDDQHSARIASHVSQFDQLPGWLRGATSADRLDYSRRLCALAVMAERAGGKSWNDGLPPILDYARKTLQDCMRGDHPEATWLTLDDVSVHIEKVVAAAIASAGQVFSDGSVEHLQMPVARFALGNLCSVPSGRMTLVMRDGGPPPEWLTVHYLTELVVRVDIGRAYPALVQRCLFSDEADVDQRERLFADQLRAQLPLKALEQKIRGEGNLSAAGYRRVCALFEPSMGDGTKTSVLRPLGWIAQPGAAADQVCNMFVIGAANIAVGPFVLYRPLAAIPLTEFASWSTLRDAISASGALQDEVLTWMSEPARQRYANGGFNQPHTVRFGLGLEFDLPDIPAPAQLSVEQVDGDVLRALFRANAQALVSLADRQSVSNAESRWAMIQRGGWLALDLVMPFFSGSAGNALWLVQLMLSVDQVLVTQGEQPRAEQAQAWKGLLLTISMILLHQGFTLAAENKATAHGGHVALSEPATSAALTESVPVPAGENSPRAKALDFSWSSLGHRLTESQILSLEALKILPEPALEPVSDEVGREGLYLHAGQWYARLDSGVYAVGFDEQGVHVADLRTPTSRGPYLKRVDDGWALDLSLRLLGGGPKRNVRQMALDNAANLKRVVERDTALELRKLAIYKEILAWDNRFREHAPALTPELTEGIEADLNELGGIFRERIELQQTLRPADRAAEKLIAKGVQGVSRRVAVYEGMLLATLIERVRVELPRLKITSVDSVTAGNVDAYLALFEEVVALNDKGVKWSGVREDYWQQLRNVAKVGETFWREEVLEIQRTNVFSCLEWRINRLWSLLELSFSREIILSGEVAPELKRLRTDLVLHRAFSSHAELEKPNDYTAVEQIDVLESSLREYQRCTLIARSARENAPTSFVVRRFDGFLEDLAWVSDRAEKRLSDLIRETTEPTTQTFEYTPRVNQPRKRVFRTRAHRTLIGRLKQGEPGIPGEVVEVPQTMSDTIVGTYHLHEDGQWVEVQDASPSRPASAERSVSLAQLKRQGTLALDGLESSINIARRQSKRADEPADMQDILTHKADQFTSLADKLARQVAQSGNSEGLDSAVPTLIDQLRSGASRLVQEGRALRIAMIKAQPPTAARLAYLAEEQEVDIARFEGRKNMSGAKRNDFLQEYVIRNKDQRVLWWAHFHYASERADAEAFTAAHLKLPEQRFIGYKAQVKAAKDNKEVIDVYRSAIGKDLARRLFLGLAG